MPNIKVRFVLTVIACVAFFGPFFAVIAVENAKRDSKLLANQELSASVKKETEEARYRYYLEVAEKRSASSQLMTDAKNLYETLLKKQPELILENQKTVTQTTLEPVVTQKTVTKPVTTTKSTSAAKPKSSAKSKTS